MAAAPSRRVALVTGANKGIGFHVVQRLAAPENNLHVLLGARDAARGREALERLGRPNNVELLEIDVASDASVEAAASAVREKHGRLHLLCNNAGWAAKGDSWGADLAERSVDVNFRGVLRAFRAFCPLLAPGGRVVNVSSFVSASSLGKCSEARRQALLREDLSVDELGAQMDEFVGAVRDNTFKDGGWPGTMYGVSKVGCSMLTRVLARDHPELRVNCVCPGWCRTDMAGQKAPLSADDGAARVAAVCLQPDDAATTGTFFSNFEPTAWY